MVVDELSDPSHPHDVAEHRVVVQRAARPTRRGRQAEHAAHDD